jgi:hypothetical protein
LIRFKVLKSQIIYNYASRCVQGNLGTVMHLPRRATALLQCDRTPARGNARRRDLFGGKDEIQAAALGRT